MTNKFRLIKIVIFFLFFICLAGRLSAQDFSVYKKKEFVFKGDTMPYRLLLPEHYEQGKKYPMILFLHGSGEKGNDNAKQLVHGGTLFLRDSLRKKYPAIVLIPQCPQKSNWVDDKRIKDSAGKYILIMAPHLKPTAAMVVLQKLVKNIIRNYPVNKKQLYVGGLSLGGMGTYDIVKRNPKLFVAAFPMCGAVDAVAAPKYKHVNWWIFHGANDRNVSPEFDKNLVYDMQQINIPVKYTLYPNTGHGCWDKAFDEPNLFNWMFANIKK